MEISFKNFKFNKGLINISLDNGQNFQEFNVADLKNGFLLKDDQDLSAVKIKGPSGLLSSLDVISNVKIQDNDEIVFTYLKNIGKFDYVKVPESGFILDSINSIPATSSKMIYLSDDEGNSYKLSEVLYTGSASKYDELKTHYKELMEKDNLKLELVFRDEITDENGNISYEEKRISLRNRIIIKEYEADSYYSFCNVASKDLGIFQTLHILSPSTETYTMQTSKNISCISVPPTLKVLNIIKDTSLVLGNINIYYFGNLSEFDNISLNINLGSNSFYNTRVFVYDRYNNSRLIA